jgi:prepilin-type N-terminal cleavage/methylation domain-containing protein
MKWLNKTGFSLIELIIVLAIIAIIAMLAGTSANTLHNAAIRLEVDKLYALCHYAQRYAMASNEMQTITFNLANNTYRFHDREEQLVADVQFGFIEGAKGPPAHPSYLLANPITFSDNHITFYPDGIIQAGTVYLVNKNHTSMYALSNAVSAVSHLRKYVYKGSWQLMR